MWQHLPSIINPIAFNLGPIEVSWYGIMYLIAFSLTWLLVRHRVKNEETGITLKDAEDFFPWGIAAVLIGGRLGEVFFYSWDYFSSHPLLIILPFDPARDWQYVGFYGMSFHGGVIALALAFIIFCFHRKINPFRLSDLYLSAIPLGYTFGRIGNFINGELYGRVTTVPWGMFFPLDPASQLRHPSQLYEALFEGIILFLIVWNIRKLKLPAGHLTAIYLIGYGALRFAIEFFREPELMVNFFSPPLTLGQVLCGLMIFGGLGILWRRR